MGRLQGLVIALVLLGGGLLAAETTAPQASKGPIPPPRREVAGTTFPCGLGELFIPARFQPDASGFDCVVFFHGAAWCARQGFDDACINGVLITVSLQDYTSVFRDAENLRSILKSTKDRLAEEGISTAPLRRLCLASFSGGYAAVREILRDAELAPAVTDVVLADSLYGERDKENPDRLSPDGMEPFAEFARRAASGEGRFIFSHLHPPDPVHRGNTTSVAARQLIGIVDADVTPVDDALARGVHMSYRATRGGVLIMGWDGMTTQDHFEHFYGLGYLLRQTSLEPVPDCRE